MKNNLKILTSHWFLIGLVVLLLNDFIFKELYGNWLTGKLSDFAGLFIFPLFWTALFPKNKNKVFLFTALFFIFWKSPYSQSLLDSWNNYMFFRIGRVVDYSDLIALLVLPVAYHFESKKERTKSLRLSPVFPFLIAIFSFIATSLPYKEVEAKKEYQFDFPIDSLKNNLFHLVIKNMYELRYDNVDSAIAHPFNMEVFINENDLTQENMIRDTMSLFVNEDFCLNGYNAEIILTGDDKGSTVKLTGFHFQCTKKMKKNTSLEGKDDNEKLTNSFENKIIKALKRGGWR